MDRGLQEVAAPGPFPGEKQRRRRREAGRGAGAARGGAGAPGPAAHTHPQIPQGVPAPPLASIPRRPGSLRATGVPKTDVPFSLPPSRPPHRGVGQGAHPVPGLSTTPRGWQPPALLVGTPQGIPVPGRTALPRLPREGALSHRMNLVLIGVPRGMGRTVPRPARLLLLPRGLLGGRNVPLCFEPSPICFLQPRIPSTGFHPCRGSPSLSTSPPRALGCRGGLLSIAVLGDFGAGTCLEAQPRHHAHRRTRGGTSVSCVRDKQAPGDEAGAGEVGRVPSGVFFLRCEPGGTKRGLQVRAGSAPAPLPSAPSAGLLVLVPLPGWGCSRLHGRRGEQDHICPRGWSSYPACR